MVAAGSACGPVDANGAASDAGDPGWRVLADPPIEPRGGAALAAGNGDAFLVGGYASDGDGVTFRDDAALFTGTAQQWRRVTLPLERVTSPRAIRAGEKWIVLGTVCSASSTDDPNCVPDGALFTEYDPVGDAWRSFGTPPVPVAGLLPMAWTGKEVAYLWSQPDRQRLLLAHDPVADRWY